MAGKSLNKVQLIGHLGKDPELRYTQSGQAVCSFSLATNERYKPQDSDEWKERTEWHRIVVWGKLAEIAGEYLSKGKQAYLEGRLQTREYEDKQHNKRSVTEVVASDLILLGGRGDGGKVDARPPHPADAPAMTGKPAPAPQGHDAAVDETPPPADIPF